MSLEFYQTLRSYLQLVAEDFDTTEPGEITINDGDNFDVKFSLRNVAPHPQMQFTNPRLQVRPGEFAELQDASSEKIISFNRDRLHRLNTAFLTVKMRAKGNIRIAGVRGTDHPFLIEQVVSARPIADFDWNAFGRVYGSWRSFTHDIEPQD